jgi:hypothetical protein
MSLLEIEELDGLSAPDVSAYEAAGWISTAATVIAVAEVVGPTVLAVLVT